MSNHKPDPSANAICGSRIVKSGALLRSVFWLPAVSLSASLTLYACLQSAYAQDNQDEIPFKFTNFHFEVNASACDWGPQILFDTEGIVSGSVKDPNGHKVYIIRTDSGLKGIGGQTEGFLEAVEPVVQDLVEGGVDCEVDEEEPLVTLEEMRDWFPEGTYEFEGRSADGEVFDGSAELTYDIPAGPEILSPAEPANIGINPAVALPIIWDTVTDSILPELGPVNVVGYHVLVKDVTDGSAAMGPLAPHQFDVDVPGTETQVDLPPAYLETARVYEFEVLATEVSGNQTITEGGFFCTTGWTGDCEPPN